MHFFMLTKLTITNLGDIKRYIGERLPEEYQVVGLITKEAWNTAQNTKNMLPNIYLSNTRYVLQPRRLVIYYLSFLQHNSNKVNKYLFYVVSLSRGSQILHTS